MFLSSFKVLAQNSGFDPQETLVKLQSEFKETGALVGVDLSTGTWRDASLYCQIMTTFLDLTAHMT